MRYLSESRAKTLAETMLRAAGLRPKPAGVVATHLVDANLRGVDSHGLERIPQYLERIDEGFIAADAEPEVASVQDAIMQVRGNGGLGIPAMQLAADRLAPLAHERGIAAAAVLDVAHTGRIGRYVETLGQCRLLRSGAWRRLLSARGQGGALRRQPWCAQYQPLCPGLARRRLGASGGRFRDLHRSTRQALGGARAAHAPCRRTALSTKRAVPLSMPRTSTTAAHCCRRRAPRAMAWH